MHPFETDTDWADEQYCRTCLASSTRACTSRRMTGTKKSAEERFNVSVAALCASRNRATE